MQPIKIPLAEVGNIIDTKRESEQQEFIRVRQREENGMRDGKGE